MTPAQTLERIFIPQWTNELQWGTEQAQWVACTALRSHGWECWGEGYWEDFIWKYHPPQRDVWCVVVPDQKPVRPDWER